MLGSFIANHLPPLIGVVIAFALILWPISDANDEAARQKRLTELNNGAPEGFFEERRALESYGAGSSRVPRYAGLLLLIFSLANLL